MTYKDAYHPQVKKDLKRLSPVFRESLKNRHIPAILVEPQKGQPLSGDLTGIFSWHVRSGGQEYRIAYVISEAIQTVFVLMVGKRGEFYKMLKKKIKA